jgi:Zn-dependent alcohol dehydrogenase
MAQKTFPTYDDPNYTTRQTVESAIITGNAAQFKWVAFASQFGYSVTTYMDTIGTSTYSGTTSAQTVSLYVVTNTSTTTTVALITSTYGPWVAGGLGSVSQAGGVDVNVLNTTTGTGGFGGVYIPGGSEIYFQLGTDATAKVAAVYDYQLAPLTPVTA